jgi:spore coat polysaccharide biosynthesis protein SpsF
MIDSIKTYEPVSALVMGISEGSDNVAFIKVAEKNEVDYIVGSEEDVLQRLITCCEKAGGTDIFRLTSESPFTYFEAINAGWEQHVQEGNDLTALDNLPDGSGFEFIKLDAYKASWEKGEQKHRSELCSLYIRENKSDFRIGQIQVPAEIKRMDIRLTIDYPEDLVLCRAVYNEFKHLAPRIPLTEIIAFVDANPSLKALVDPFVAEGLKTMYI